MPAHCRRLVKLIKYARLGQQMFKFYTDAPIFMTGQGVGSVSDTITLQAEAIEESGVSIQQAMAALLSHHVLSSGLKKHTRVIMTRGYCA